MSAEEPLLKMLDKLGISWQMHEHDAVFTVEASASLHSAIPGAHTKNLFLKDAGNQFWLVTAPHNARVDLKALPTVIGSKKTQLWESRGHGTLACRNSRVGNATSGDER